MRKKVVAVLLAGGLVLSMAACGKDVEDAGSSTKDGGSEGEISEGTEMEEIKEASSGLLKIGIQEYQKNCWMGEYVVSSTSASPFLYEESEQEYPKLAETLKARAEGQRKLGEQWFDDLLELAQDTLEYTEDIDYRIDYKYTVDMEVARADSAVVSLLDNYYYYSGGAHGDYGFAGYNVDTETGEVLEIQDIVTDYSAFLDVVKAKIETEYPDELDAMFSIDEDFERMKSGEEMFFEWVITNLGITTYFNPYALGPYAIGTQQVTIYFDDNPELFEEKYSTPTESYVVPLFAGNYLDVDMDGDGAKERLVYAEDYIYYDWDTTYEYPDINWIVNAGDSEFTLELMNNRSAYLVYTNGRYYFYAPGRLASDGTGFFQVIDLKNQQVLDMEYYSEEIGETSTYNAIDDVTGESEVTCFSFVDPENFYLQTYAYKLGTYLGYRPYCVGADGKPEAKWDYYLVDTTNVLKTAQNLTAYPVAEDGTEGDAVTIPEGTYLRAVRTDDENWIDLQVVDSSKVEDVGYDDTHYYTMTEEEETDWSKETYRFHLELSDEGGYIVNGEGHEYDLFEGILYAG